MSNIYEWSQEAASNANVDEAIKWELGQPAKLTNDSARAMMQRFAEYLVDLAPKLSTAHAQATAEPVYCIKSCSPIVRLREGMRFYLIPHCDSKGADKLAVNAEKAVQIYKFSTVKQEVTALEAGDLTKGNCYELLYAVQLHVDGNVISGWFVANLYGELAGQTAISGTILSFAGLKPPQGWLFCDGSMLESAKYPQLYKIIGQNYGGGEGSKFALPDLRGVFIRGFDSGRGLDIGRIFGSFQADENKAHKHKLSLEEIGPHGHNRLVEWSEEGKPAKPVHKDFPKMFNDDEGLYRGPDELEVTGKHTHKITTVKQGASAGMRPKNISINYIIKI
ncbi:tail fiber protein [Bartonella sp. TP]|uniref:tail fiber protein n=1 Tax=Bartonella sp. TP TaxID=3057550 RepID=UPI0025B14ECD|nr:tail fiber protein [Bartonella sp. TP]WJW80502.1 tail fiber protein [Bartonella sp. TP]